MKNRLVCQLKAEGGKKMRTEVKKKRKEEEDETGGRKIKDEDKKGERR